MLGIDASNIQNTVYNTQYPVGKREELIILTLTFRGLIFFGLYIEENLF